MKLNELQAQVVAHLFEQLPLEDPVDTLDFSLSGEFKGRFVCIEAKVQGTGSDTSLVANLPSYSNTVFIAFTRGHTRETTLILANLEDYLRETQRSLAAGDVVVLPANQAAVGSAAPHAVMLMNTSVSPELQNLPEALNLPAGIVNFFFALGLDEQEFTCLKEQGFDVLMDQFIASGKDLFMN
ncbi:suppressor of fused domain protein [Pseudomonas sp. NPDC089758]|uniref:suppressor of fused domain protein n=1 Tax=Pseudomonas sp. NPDC089758 TaxID=3364473 RepID=UPI003815FF77